MIGGRESPSNAAGAAEEEGRQTPYDTQVLGCLDHLAKESTWRLVAPPFLAEVSRSELWERYDLDGVREAVRSGKARIVLYHATERLAVGDKLAYVLVEMEKYGGRLEFVVDPIDPTTLNGQVVLMGKGVAGLIEQQRTRERTQRGRGTRLGANRALPGGRARYGYKWVYLEVGEGDRRRLIKDRREPHPVHAPVVAELFRRAYAGETAGRQVDRLYAAGVASPAGKPRWTELGIRFILKDPIYKGEGAALRWEVHKRDRLGPDGRRTGTKYRTVRERAPEARHPLPGEAPALVAPEVWEGVQHRLADNEARAARNNRHPDASPLRGYVFCAACGARLRLEPAKRRGQNAGTPAHLPLRLPQAQGRRGDAGSDSGRAEGQEVACTASVAAGPLAEEVWAGLQRRLLEPDVREATLEGGATNTQAAADVDAASLLLAQLERDCARAASQPAGLGAARLPDVYATVAGELQALLHRKERATSELAGRRLAQESAGKRGAEWDAPAPTGARCCGRRIRRPAPSSTSWSACTWKCGPPIPPSSPAAPRGGRPGARCPCPESPRSRPALLVGTPREAANGPTANRTRPGSSSPVPGGGRGTSAWRWRRTGRRPSSPAGRP